MSSFLPLPSSYPSVPASLPNATFHRGEGPSGLAQATSREDVTFRPAYHTPVGISWDSALPHCSCQLGPSRSQALLNITPRTVKLLRTDTSGTPTSIPKRVARRPGQSIACGWCGSPIVVPGQGRVPKWCSSSCRHRAWELTRAAASGLAARTHGVDTAPRRSLNVNVQAVHKKGTAALNHVEGKEIEPSLCLPTKAARSQLTFPPHAVLMREFESGLPGNWMLHGPHPPMLVRSRAGGSWRRRPPILTGATEVAKETPGSKPRVAARHRARLFGLCGRRIRRFSHIARP